MEKKNEKLMENVATGVSAAIGATVGVVAGNTIAQPASAAETVEVEPVDVDEETEEVVAEVVETAAQETAAQEAVQPSVIYVEHHYYHDAPAQQSQTAGQQPVDQQHDEPQIHVVSDEVVETEDGPMELAVVEIEGQAIAVADTNMDGEANIMVSDINQNGVIDDGEAVDVTNQHISMEQFHEPMECGMGNEIAQADDIDFVNDANVDDFLA